ncbi:MAG: RNA polymerase sigma factor [Bacteroidia bacterium]|nr:RNA polymerase sigma factor [Bacteroidia bacterium]
MSDSELKELIAACRKGNRESQEKLYRKLYNYAMSICLRYSRDREEAKEIVNDGFVKVFSRMEKYSDDLSFQGWVRRIMINSAIDFYRKNQKHYHSLDIVYASHVSVNESAVNNLSEEEIMSLVQQLAPSYRIVFNLYVMEGFKHEEIAQKLNISTGTSKSNLAKARMKLQMMLEALYGENCRNYG